MADDDDGEDLGPAGRMAPDEPEPVAVGSAVVLVPRDTPGPASSPDEHLGEVERQGPLVLDADSWDAPPPWTNDDYQGRRRAHGPALRILFIVALVLVGVAALVIPWALTSGRPTVGVGPPPTMADNPDNGDDATDQPPGVSSTSELPTPRASAPRTSSRPSATAGSTNGPSPSASPAALVPTVTLLSGGRPTATSALENPATLAGSNAVDGNPSTRWGSAFSDPQWISVDLGSACAITRVRLTWEVAYARAYQIQTSTDNATWTTIYATTSGDGGVDDVTVTGTGRWIRIFGSQRATQYGYSLWELEIYGTAP